MGEKRLTVFDRSSNWSAALKNAAKKATISGNSTYDPVLIEMSSSNSRKKLEDLIGDVPITQVIDNYDEQLAELFISKNAQLYKANYEVKTNSIAQMLDEHYGGKPEWEKGSWVYYPWSGVLVHVLDREQFWELRTIRNQILVTAVEQEKYRSLNVACAGMSVGSNGAAGIVLTSGSENIKLADGAVFSGSNLNRARTGVANIGINKCMVMARELYEMNPYIRVSALVENISAQNINSFFDDPWPAQLIVDEIDDIGAKIMLRIEAKKRKIPLIMITEPGNQIMVDVERYDLNSKVPIFHGLAPGIERALERGALNDREKIKYVATIIGVKNLPIRDQKAMLKVGSEIPSPPQLGSTAMMAGGVIAYVARQIAIGADLKQGRHVISLEKELNWGPNKAINKYKHYQHTRALNQAIDSM